MAMCRRTHVDMPPNGKWLRVPVLVGGMSNVFLYFIDFIEDNGQDLKTFHFWLYD